MVGIDGWKKCDSQTVYFIYIYQHVELAQFDHNSKLMPGLMFFPLRSLLMPRYRLLVTLVHK